MFNDAVDAPLPSLLSRIQAPGHRFAEHVGLASPALANHAILGVGYLAWHLPLASPMRSRSSAISASFMSPGSSFNGCAVT